MGKMNHDTDHREREVLRSALTFLADKYDTMAKVAEKIGDEQLRKLNMVRSAQCVRLRGKFTEGGSKQDATDNQKDVFEADEDVPEADFEVIGEIGAGEEARTELVCPNCGNRDDIGGPWEGVYPRCSAQCKGEESPPMVEWSPKEVTTEVLWKCPSCEEPHSHIPERCTQCGFVVEVTVGK